MNIKNKIINFLNEPKNLKLTYKQIVESLSKTFKLDKKFVENAFSSLFLSGDYIVVGNKVFLSEKLGLLKGKILASTKGYAFCEIINQKVPDYYIPYTKLNGALNNDIVLIKKLLGKKGDSTEAEVVKILQRANETVVGKIQTSKNYAFVVADDEKFEGDIYIPKKYIDKAKDGEKVVIKIDEFAKKGKSHKGKVIEVLGEEGNHLVEELSIIRSHNLYEEFSKEIAKLNYPTTVKEEELVGRKDLTNLNIFTIDGEDAKDLDDAVSISKNSDGLYHLGVHIADVSYYVKPNSIVDKEAYRRGTSVYFPNLVLPMLPKQLSNGICSLNEKTTKLTMSVFIDIDKEGDVKKYEICESFINSKHRMTYTDVFKIINNDKEMCEKYKDIQKDILVMNELSKILTKKRNKLGAINFDIPEPYFKVDKNGNILDLIERERNDAHKLIENFMVTANECVADYAVKNKIPFVYRTHEKPYEEKLNDFISYCDSLGFNFKINLKNYSPLDFSVFLNSLEEGTTKDVISKVLLRTMQKAKYTPSCQGHFGLASKCYCHFTSPIRRYPDLVVHRMLKLSLKNKLTGKVKNDMLVFTSEASIISSEREKLAEVSEREVDDLFKCYYMEDKKDKTFTGSISGVTSSGIFVMLSNTVEGFIKREDLPDDMYEFQEKFYTLKGNKNSYTLGDKLKVKVDFIDTKKRRINFVLQ